MLPLLVTLYTPPLRYFVTLMPARLLLRYAIAATLCFFALRAIRFAFYAYFATLIIRRGH